MPGGQALHKFLMRDHKSIQHRKFVPSSWLKLESSVEIRSEWLLC